MRSGCRYSPVFAKVASWLETGILNAWDQMWAVPCNSSVASRRLFSPLVLFFFSLNADHENNSNNNNNDYSPHTGCHEPHTVADLP